MWEGVAEPVFRLNCRDIALRCLTGNQLNSQTSQSDVPTIQGVLQHPRFPHRVRRCPQGGGVSGYGFHKGEGVWRTPIYIYFHWCPVNEFKTLIATDIAKHKRIAAQDSRPLRGLCFALMAPQYFSGYLKFRISHIHLSIPRFGGVSFRDLAEFHSETWRDSIPRLGEIGIVMGGGYVL